MPTPEGRSRRVAVLRQQRLESGIRLERLPAWIEAKDVRRDFASVGEEEVELVDGFVLRYDTAASGDGLPPGEGAFLACSFWLADALWEIGRQDEARDIFVDALRMRNRYGLLSEDVHPVTGKLWGNFPQTYSMSGLILTAIKLSRSWGDRYWRGSS